LRCFCYFQNCPKKTNRPKGENSPNLVTLTLSTLVARLLALIQLEETFRGALAVSEKTLFQKSIVRIYYDRYLQTKLENDIIQIKKYGVI
jgi:hypothetical protein